MSIHRARILLIELGKVLPFVVCGIVLISYIESLVALIREDFLIYEDSMVLNKPLSWMIAQWFEYNLVTIVIMSIISVAIETCVWNKITIAYLTLQLIGKNYSLMVELYLEDIYLIVITNILTSGLLTYKGINQLITKKK